MSEFELGEDRPRNLAGRLAQEANWRDANVDARHHFSLREALQVQKPSIINALKDYQVVRVLANGLRLEPKGGAGGGELPSLSPEVLEIVVGHAMPGQSPLVRPLFDLRDGPNGPPTCERPSNFRVFARVRPLNAQERTGGEYEAIGSHGRSTLVVHDARMSRSGRRLSMMHSWYKSDGLFGPEAAESSVHDAVLLPLMRRVLAGQGDATVILYGQTGAGKTHTMMSMIGRVEDELDLTVAAAGGTAAAETAAAGTAAAETAAAVTATVATTAAATAEGVMAAAAAVEGAAELRDGVEVLFFEVATKGCNDLLNARHPIVLRSDENDTVHARGATTCTVHSGRELRRVLADGLALRSTVETQANPISSRSHAVLSLRFSSSGNMLRLVDLAGSERNYETHHMTSRDFQRESAAINKGLMALKDCFRAAARSRAAVQGAGMVGEPNAATATKPAIRVPYRGSMLTRVLRDCFADERHRTALLAAVAPGAESVIHTFNTLDHVTLMAPHLSNHTCEVNVPMNLGHQRSYDGVPVHEWTAAQVLEWLGSADGGRFAYVEVPPGTDGSTLLRMNARRLTELVEEGGRAGRGTQQLQADVAWTLRSTAKVGRALFDALRDAQRDAPIR